ncbi:glycoside hydrolase family 3 N-terminal domain-containing protein [Cellulomonas sp. KRMCY2]|uniref:glycoside hydrolase family 3 N-terminal domain-containing protein n=1 Tax=Cellulomonas sp. KRMCY2 TaxID=1304865 RepID=UPI0012DC5B1A
MLALSQDHAALGLNTVELNRSTVDAQVDQRTLHELYLAPFQDVVQDADVGMVMCAYTKVNGTQACDSADLIGDVLRGDWGFDGIVRTDAGAAHRLESLPYGLDQEFRSESVFGLPTIWTVLSVSDDNAGVGTQPCVQLSRMGDEDGDRFRGPVGRRDGCGPWTWPPVCAGAGEAWRTGGCQ